MSKTASDGLPLQSSSMSEATIMLGRLMHYLPVASIEVDVELGIRVEARTEAGFLRWASAVVAEQIGEGTELGHHTRTATGTVAQIPATVILPLGPIGVAS